MRVSTLKTDIGFCSDLRDLKVYVDGKHMLHVITADTTAGVVVTSKTGQFKDANIYIGKVRISAGND